ncbi:1-acyl-sn-glycerol-3-phosphate acyltransferase [Pseudaestuariivita sp.]|uniref:1-acyl-sn-glycerol-3-phosphate acyltransferase n=1 Tax=Pseudaestuariivita sp. TaxID=2211669 RepID=UPI004058630F
MEETLDALIAERAPWLYRHGVPSRAARALFHRLLGYRGTVALAKSFEHQSASTIMQSVGEEIARHVSPSGLSRIPTAGPALIVANHPTGIADGIVLHTLISARRKDAFFFANHDILRLFPQMADMIAPVEWRREKRSHGKTRQTMAFTRRAIEAERIGVIFPSGRLAKRRGTHLEERPWMASAAMIARKFDLPVIPVRISAHNSALFYAFDKLHPTLRDITLFHETMNKRRHHFSVTIGEPVAACDLPRSSEAAIAELKARVLSLGGDASRIAAFGGVRRDTAPREPLSIRARRGWA